MTKEQIEILRSLIRGEIEAALMNEKDYYRFALEQEEANEQGWQTFIDSFTRLRMTTTGGDNIGDV